MTLTAFLILFVFAIAGYMVNRRTATAIRTGGTNLHSLSHYHGLYSLLMILVPVFVVLVLFLILETPVINSFVMASLPEDRVDRPGRRRHAACAGGNPIDRERTDLRHAG